MLKGCQRRIIMVKDTGSKYFEGAYFVLRSELPGSVRESEMISEAQRMIGSYAEHPVGISYKANKTRKPYIAAIMLLSAALVIALTALLLFIF